MSDKSAIEWTEATWNPVTGCSKVSPGCAHCYAETLSLRFGWSKLPWTPENAAANVILHPERLNQPLKWREPRMIFVNSMSDLFHELIPDAYVWQVFNIMAQCPQHTFQVLTKRPERMAELVDMGAGEELPNVWLGVSIENSRYTYRADVLREIPAAVRFISAEPLLGSLASLDLADIHWLIVGGESGPVHRPMREQWAVELRDAALDNGTAFFFKQWGGRTPKSGGRLLQGRKWDEMPAKRREEREGLGALRNRSAAGDRRLVLRPRPLRRQGAAA